MLTTEQREQVESLLAEDNVTGVSYGWVKSLNDVVESVHVHLMDSANPENVIQKISALGSASIDKRTPIDREYDLLCVTDIRLGRETSFYIYVSEPKGVVANVS